MRAALLVALALVASVLGAAPAPAAPGDPDLEFGVDGTVLTDFDSGFDAALGVAIQDDGRIVAAGYADRATTDFGVVRYRRGGTPDESFGGNGIQIADFGGDDQANAVALQEDGKVVVAGFAASGSDRDFAVARFRAGGVLDETFSGEGMKTIDFGSEVEEAFGVAVRPDGKIVVAGYTFDPVALAADFAIARLKPNGTLDHSFSQDGKRTVDFGNDESIFAMDLLPNGRILVAGGSNDEATTSFALARLRPGGAPDATFSGDGIAYATFGSSASAFSIDVRPDGKIVLAGGSDGELAVARFRSGGGLDGAFSDDGKVTIDLSPGPDEAHGVAFQDDGKIVVVGTADNGVDDDFVAVRFRAGGALDQTFGDAGRQLIDFGFGDDVASGMALQPNGKIVVSGLANSAFDEDFGLARLLAA